VYVKEQVRYAISEATTLEDALADLETELRALEAADPQRIDTTLLIFPRAFADFVDYNDALFFADRLVQQLRLGGVLQIASFHPAYQFEGSEADDIENYTNRAPYPMLHLLREDSIARAVDAFRRVRDLREEPADAAPPRPRRLARMDGARATTTRRAGRRRTSHPRRA
jgi:hypothetical protein